MIDWLYQQLSYTSAARRGGAAGMARDAARPFRAHERARCRAYARPRAAAVVVRGPAVPERCGRRPHADVRARGVRAAQSQRAHQARRPARARRAPQAPALRERRTRLLRGDHAEGAPQVRGRPHVAPRGRAPALPRPLLARGAALARRPLAEALERHFSELGAGDRARVPHEDALGLRGPDAASLRSSPTRAAGVFTLRT